MYGSGIAADRCVDAHELVVLDGAGGVTHRYRRARGRLDRYRRVQGVVATGDRMGLVRALRGWAACIGTIFFCGCLIFSCLSAIGFAALVAGRRHRLAGRRFRIVMRRLSRSCGISRDGSHRSGVSRPRQSSRRRSPKVKQDRTGRAQTTAKTLPVETSRAFCRSLGDLRSSSRRRSRASDCGNAALAQDRDRSSAGRWSAARTGSQAGDIGAVERFALWIGFRHRSWCCSRCWLSLVRPSGCFWRCCLCAAGGGSQRSRRRDRAALEILPPAKLRLRSERDRRGSFAPRTAS